MTRRYFRHFACLSLFVLCGITAINAQTKNHVVEQGETLYRIARTNGLTVEQLLAANPGMSPETLKAGDVLKVPTGNASSVSNVQSFKNNTSVSNGETPSVAVLLPFSATGIEGARSLEFYRGFLMGAEKYSQTHTPCRIYAYDEGSADKSLVQTMEEMRRNNVQAVIGPVYPDHLKPLADFARSERVRMIVPFYSRAEQVNTNPFVYLINTPKKFEQEFMSDLFVCTFKKTTIALMRFSGGDEYDFVCYLKNRLLALGYPVTEFSADASTEQMLAACKNDAGVVIVPDASDAYSQAIALRKVNALRSAYPSYSIRLVGYSSWLTQDNLKPQMFSCDTYVFTGSFYNSYDSATRKFDADYAAWFHAKPQDINPRMGLLGHDAALHLLTGISKWGKDFSSQPTDAAMLQSDIRFERTEDEGGLVNSSMCFIHFKPDQTIDKVSAPKR